MSLAGEGDRFAGALRAALQLADAQARYEALTAVQAECDALVSAIKLARGEALDDMLSGTLTQAEVADAVGLVRQKVQKLINAARAAQHEEGTMSRLPSTQQIVLDKLSDGETRAASGEAIQHLVNRGLVEPHGDGYRATAEGLAQAATTPGNTP